MNELTVLNENQIKNKIYTIRGVQVIIDRDLAKLYDVDIKRLNEQVKRNMERFPEDFMFQLTASEYNSLRSQIATLEQGRGKIAMRETNLKQKYLYRFIHLHIIYGRNRYS